LEAEEPAQGNTTEGSEEDKVEDKRNESKVKRMPITKSTGAMLNGEEEVELVNEDNDVQIMDMSMEEQPESPEVAGANAKSPSTSPEPTRTGPVGYCRDELYETHDEAELMMDEAQAEEEGGESPPYVAPSARSPSPLNLAAEYKNGHGASSLSQALLESLERQRQSMAEVGGQANRARLARETVRRNREGRDERSRSKSRSSQGRPEQQPIDEGEVKR
jgi:hypothetical protein